MARDPYKYYRIEARELIDGLAQGTLALGRDGGDPARAAQLMRLAHTLKGAARVVRQAAVAEQAHAYEDCLGPYRDSGKLPAPVVAQMLAITDAMQRELDALAAPAEPAPAVAAPVPVAAPAVAATPAATSPPAEPGPHGADRFGSVRVAVDDMDDLLEGVSMLSVQLAALRQHALELERGRSLAASLLQQLAPRAGTRGIAPANLARAHALASQIEDLLERSRRGIGGGVDRADVELRAVQDQAGQLRLLPASRIFDSLERAVHDVSTLLGKPLRFETRGGDQRLDAQVLGPLSESLLHVVRNAADHGIEDIATRIAAGKPEQGRIQLAVDRHGGRIVFRVSDDGRGLDLQAIRDAARRRGHAHADTLDAQPLIDLLLQGGLSTKTHVTEISGRGVGLDLVRDIALRLKGSVHVQTRAGQGTTVEVQVPASLTALPALLLQAGTATCAVPLASVRRTLRVAEHDVSRTDDGAVIRFDDHMLPIAPLSELLGHSAPDRHWSTVVVLQSRDILAGIVVDRLIGHADRVVRPLPASVGRVPLCLGASFDAEGDPQLVLDPDGLVDAVRRHRHARSTAPRTQPCILVIDDSLTTRMLEQSILESAGYEVHLATSAEEGMVKARQRQYQLFVVDIEMPGMNGFEFISATRADARLAQTPAMLVSSLNSAEDRARGARAGARAFIVKGEFDQNRFLDTVRGLAG